MAPLAGQVLRNLPLRKGKQGFPQRRSGAEKKWNPGSRKLFPLGIPTHPQETPTAPFSAPPDLMDATEPASLYHEGHRRWTRIAGPGVGELDTLHFHPNSVAVSRGVSIRPQLDGAGGPGTAAP